ncbi:hypothetical protein ATO6_01120 [Oceanicola sp. 22II-s10i]|uniref:cupredoxin domain-containing protein n=1 Tax=Oceanicola sp. 22II-s10i TaxID=1317116 RepID=UPI000B52368C|nr:cupredoxin family copper-binding protein [Oceanicola sp. 22II-s10i]OWU85573.1 hypothetical protein ATO6_01120 [Oceanicola sp. 22II-s10i]
MTEMTRRSTLGLLAAGAAAPLFAGSAHAASHADVVVTIKGFAFSPASLTVKAGTVVAFVNEDGAPHTSTSKDGGWDTGRLNKGQRKEIEMGKAGTFAYVCAFHPNMKGTVVVE